ncbi:MAG: deoxyribodipyrimidine photo-lyase [Methanomicrobiaceae archaeon]|nr:deoxyribodipyrimidine photo-lyase [Methanomicrobiaceae archaeon]
MTLPERIHHINERSLNKGSYVLYWMQASPRAKSNLALEYAIRRANRLGLPVAALFCLTGEYPGANLRHYHFLIEGVLEAKDALEARGVFFVLRRGSPPVEVADLAGDAALVVADCGYLRIQREWRNAVAGMVKCPFVLVEDNVAVPVRRASPKEEWSAATFRRKIRPHLDRFLILPEPVRPDHSGRLLEIPSEPLASVERVLRRLSIDRSIDPVPSYHGGGREAHRRLTRFLAGVIERFEAERNDPTADALSHMSPYLHFGQISPIDITQQVRKRRSAGADAYLEELIVRRELAVNFVFYNPRYDSYEGLPGWAKATLAAHEGDRREYVYSFEEFEQASTHDPYWNAAQLEMVHTGKMHGYMRMYWGKKILEWSETPAAAFEIAISLNNRYELDGRDPNGYAGVAWCFGKHDRAWAERPVFGKVRYMNAAGLRRKFDADAYVEKVQGYAGSMDQ